MDIKLQNKQIEQLSLALSVDDVLNCIRNNYDDYINFLNGKLKTNEITINEYNKELNLVNNLKNTKELCL